MKIALVGRYGEDEIVTGPERVARELYNELSDRKKNVVFIEYFFSSYNNNSILKKLFGSEVYYKPKIKRLGIFPLLLLIFREKFDAIHIINIQRFILFILIIKPLLKSKIVVTFHSLIKNEIPTGQKLKNRFFLDLWVEKLLVAKSELLIFPSNLLHETFAKNYNLSQKIISIIPNGVSKIFSNQHSSFPPIEESINIVFYNGFNSSINRGIDQLFELVKKVRNKINLFIIGDKTKYTPPDNINLTYTKPMMHTEFIKFMQDKHFVIKSSTFDSFSIMIAECMCLGVIPIINEEAGIKDLIEHGTNGFFYNSSYNELSDLINDIYERNFDLEKISTNAKNIFKQLNWENITQQYDGTYKSVL